MPAAPTIPFPDDARALFDTILPEAFRRFPARLKDFDQTIIFNITGTGGGRWTLLCRDTPSCVRSTVTDQPTVEITMDHDALKTCLTDFFAGFRLFMAGRISVVGEPGDVATLAQFYEMSRRHGNSIQAVE